MKVLFASIPQPANRFVADLKQGIEEFAEVIWDFNEFWNCNNKYDVVHIHEPEYLSYEIESYLYNNNPIEKSLWDRLIKCLEHWKKESVIVNTRHVQEPHLRIDIDFKNWYKIVLSYCDGIAHFANYSIKQFNEYYPGLNHIKHTVIPHQNYLSLENNSDKLSARKQLKIKQDDIVMLVFGNIKEHEKKLIKEAFNYIPGKRKVLLTPGWKIPKRKISYIRLREWIYKIDLWISKRKYNHRYNLGFIKEEDAHLYSNASDFLFIPRLNELNSGNITFGFTFGLVVVGKNTSDIGEILMETKNPVFEVGSSASLKNSIVHAIKLSKNGHGKINRDIALEKYGIRTISQLYKKLYETKHD